MIGSIPVTFWPGILVAIAFIFAFSWILVRHIGLAALVALSPLPGFGAAVVATRLSPVVFDYLPGFILAGALAGVIAPFVVTVPGVQAVRNSLRDLWPVFLALLALFVPVIFLGPTALICMASEISAVAITAGGAMLLSYDEDFVVRINRAVEARVREIERLDFLTLPRWGVSIGGIALIFSVLGFFGAQKDIIAPVTHPAVIASSLLIFFAGVFAVSRNIRRSVAAILAMVPVALLVIAVAARFGLTVADVLLPLMVSAMSIFLMAAAAQSFERNGDNWQTSTRRSLERFGPVIVVTTIASAAAIIPSEWTSRVGIVESIALLLGGMAALILQPALATMLYSLFPKRVTLEDAFRKR